MVGYFQREDMREGKHKGTIYVDLGKVEGILPKRNQSPRERYEKNDRIRAIVTDVKKTNSKGSPGLQLVLSRTEPDFVRRIMEQEIPETYDKTVEIYKIVREPGYRTKVAVYSRREDIDPVGACVGQKGVRIQSVIKELDGEKIDILKYDPDPVEFIKNALSPAEVSTVMILDADKRQALACVPESQFSLAIGKQGLNVRLANRLVDWNIDVKTDDEYEECSQLIAESRKAAESLFVQEEDTITTLEELPGVDQAVVAILKEQGIVDIGQFLDACEKGSLEGIEGLSAESIAAIEDLINAEVELVEEERAPVDEAVAEEEFVAEDEEYLCPECNTKITIDMTSCPNCGIGLSFEVVDEE
jgi:N utilization substance protein A